MGARQSKRSVDISNPPKKGEVEGGVEAEGGKLERLEEGDVATLKATLNGTAPHAEKEVTSPVTEEVQPMVNGDTTTTVEVAVKEEAKTDEKDENVANGTSETPESEMTITPESGEKTKKKWTFRSISFSRKDVPTCREVQPMVNGETTTEEVAVKEEAKAEEKEENVANGTSETPESKTSEESATTPESGEKKKKKEKSKKKWSFRSISFSKKDKSKPNMTKDESKNGKVTKEEPVAEVVEAEAAAATPVTSSEEPKKEEAVTVERTATEEKKEEEKTEVSSEAKSPEVAAPAPLAEAVPEPVTTPTPASEPTKVEEPPTPTPAPEPVVETKPELIPQEVKSEEMPPPLPASPPPTEAPPPTPIAPTPAPVELIPDVVLPVEPDTLEPEVVGGGGESMAEPEDVEPVEPVLDAEEKVEELLPMVNGIGEHNHQFVEEFNEKVEIVTDNLKTIVTESIISTQVTENSEDQSEQTASAAE